MVLQTEMVYLYPKDNSELHHTNLYEIVHDEENPIAVLRRGEKFTLALRFINRDFDEERDEVKVKFNYGPDPNTIKGTQGIVKVQPSIKKFLDKEQKYWFSNVLDMSDGTITMEVFAPPSIPIGVWKIQVECCLKRNRNEKSIYDHEKILYFLCNPWNCHDLVYMHEERLLDEYILSDVGKIWKGSVGSHRGEEWIFGQFDRCILPAVWYILEKSELEYSLRGDPIRLSRTISKMVNDNDDNGVLYGNWTGHYEGGTDPSAWPGSIDILEEYLTTESPVKYGQCWVYAGVVTTICRAIGIPSRVVSNIVSAHDTNSTMTIDKLYDEHNKEIIKKEGEVADLLWTFHVWNDVYMARPDLPPGYGGWQAIDATPQEISDNFVQCGPASLEAIKQGQVGLAYDVSFLVSSVNADFIKWKKDPEAELGYSKIYCNKIQVGRYILTKKPFLYDYNGDRDREDITYQYKPPEGSKEERLSLMNAVRASQAAKMVYQLPDPEHHDVEFVLEDIDRIKIGEDFQIAIKVSSKSTNVRTIRFTLSAQSVYYNGVKAERIIKREGEIHIGPHAMRVLQVPVPANKYLPKLVEYSIMKICAIATVVETNQTWADEDDFQVDKPSIKITVPDELPVGEISIITLEFMNPLDIPLTNCKFTISGPSVTRNQIVRCDNVAPGELVRAETAISPRACGEKKVVATFTSRELSDIRGSSKIDVV